MHASHRWTKTHSQFYELRHTLIRYLLSHGQSQDIRFACVQIVFDCVRVAAFIPMLAGLGATDSIVTNISVSLYTSFFGQFRYRRREKPVKGVADPLHGFALWCGTFGLCTSYGSSREGESECCATEHRGSFEQNE